MSNDFGLWFYNISVSKEFISSILGGIVGGGLSIFVARLTLNIEFKNQNKIINQQNKEKETNAFLIIKDEIEENIMRFNDYIDTDHKKEIREIKENPIINLSKFKGEIAFNSSWNEVKGIIIGSPCKELTKEIIKLYHNINRIKNATSIRENVLKELIDIGNKITKKIDENYK